MTIYSGFTHWKLWFSIHIHIWLVVWNMIFMTFPSYWECHHPNWRSPSFFRGVGSTTNQIIWGYGGENIWMIKCGDSCALNPFMAQPSPRNRKTKANRVRLLILGGRRPTQNWVTHQSYDSTNMNCIEMVSLTLFHDQNWGLNLVEQ